MYKRQALIPFDQNDDGLLDLLVANSDGAPSLLLNTTEGGGHWLKIVLRDETTSNTQAVGARVRIVAQKGAPEWIGEVRTGSGYQSSGPGALHIGLGDTSYVDSFEVRWPDSEVYEPVSYTHLRAHETVLDLVCRLLLEKKKQKLKNKKREK